MASTPLFQWKPFQFFDKEVIKDDSGRLASLEITCCTCGRGQLIFGDAEGYIHIVDRNLNFEAFQGFNNHVTHLKQLKSVDVLVGIGADNTATLKIWSLERRDARGQPQMLKSIKLFPKAQHLPPAVPLRLNLNPDLKVMFGGTVPGQEATEGGEREPYAASHLTSPVTCFDVTEELNYAVVGTTNGQLIFIKSDILHDKNPKIRTLQRTESRQDDGKPISFVGFKKGSNNSGYSLFVVYQGTTWLYKITAKNEMDEELDGSGAAGDCCCLSDDYDLVVAVKSPEVVYFHTDDGRGPCFAFEGEKKKVYWFRSYLLVITQDQAAMSHASALGARQGTAAENRMKMNLTVYDLKNKLKAFSGGNAVFFNVSYVLSDWGSVFVITNEPDKDGLIHNRLYQLEEKDTQTKLEMLFKKNLYTTAINLANSQQFDLSYITEISKKYADHLYTKGDYDAAVTQYIRTIGKLEPSYVIRKFLDAQRIHNLTRYLEELHSQAQANADHTTLLLNCYTKLKDTKKLQTFVHQTDQSLHYDVETAIKVCRQAGYYDDALHLALQNKEHNWYIKIQIEDKKKYADALQYIQGLPLNLAEQYLQTYGKMLVSQLPEPTTKVLMDVCTEWVPTNNSLSNQTLTNSELLTANQGQQGTAGRSRPENFINCFVDAPYYLMRFLECVAKEKLSLTDGAYTTNSIVENTLLELYLTRCLRKSVNDVEEKETTTEMENDWRKRRAKALNILKKPDANYDDEHALVLVQTHDFREGILHLYEKLGLYQDILQYYMQIRDYPNVIATCKRFESQDPNMWVQVLLFFTQDETNMNEQEIQEVLAHVDREGLVSPLVVMQILSNNSKTKLDTIKDYIEKRLDRDLKVIEEDKVQIKKYRAETKKMRDELKDMQSTHQVFQINKCSMCQSPLDLPATHFLCTHSFHHRCLGEHETECPICAQELRKVMEIKRTLQDSVDKHDQFFAQLKEAPDGFSTVAEYFGRGIFNGDYAPPSGLHDDSDDDDD